MPGISSLQIIFAGSKRVGSWWTYRNVISPFYRLYHIDGGEGSVMMYGRVNPLTPG